MEHVQEASQADLRAERDTDGAEQGYGDPRPNWIVPTDHMDEHSYKLAAYGKAVEALRAEAHRLALEDSAAFRERNKEPELLLLRAREVFSRVADWLEAQA